ncbi:hypothetical protein Poli38472_006259 [Pythium oligandrum]|uniref:FHA domain-containing protein n=1 Tax=Pythium oligandrum TaxID=41045 RepID=A0A8K1FMY6_PYTOL|nr:hypothetical protein Poli38472_006259 [Pythium oligandrum]|eukprot:TMW68791.1 hypothetical protein Poli38472_006259 [Pythium oligandrum]
MWVLDVVNAATSSVDTSFYLIAGEWSIGRKKCHFNFQADTSISRTHAVIRVGALASEQLRDPHSRPPLVLVDQNSRFGSFVNQEQCFGERELKNGDQVTFGAKRTVLRVRYQAFVLVASRIQRANRTRVNDTCQRIGMHLVASETKDATHCIMEPGRIVATVKVLWALVYNQPVVTTPWIFAILERKSLSEPLPRCEEYLPTDETMPSVASNYLPNPMRKTLFHRHVVVFLTPQPMEELISAMDGAVVAAYKDDEHDDLLLRQIEQLSASRQVLIVEPHPGSGFSSVLGSSDGRDVTTMSHIDVERRVSLFRSMGAVFTSIQELAASVIFAKAPISSSECSFSSSLAGHHSFSAQISSFPEHLSLKPSLNDDDHEHEDDVEVPTPVRQDDVPLSAPTPTLAPQTRVHLSDDFVDDSMQVKEEPASGAVAPSADFPDVVMKAECDWDVGSQPTHNNILDVPVRANTLRVSELIAVDQSQNTPVDNEVDVDDAPVLPVDWVSTRGRPAKELSAADMIDDKSALDLTQQPLVISCSLVVKRPQSAQSSSESTSDVPNFKRFKKGNGYATQSRASLFPKQTVISVTVDNAEREALHQNLELLQEQERIAEELFAMVEKRTTRRKL